jgi:amino acid adenylation domain-containing protein
MGQSVNLIKRHSPLSPEKQALLEKRLQRGFDAALRPSVISRRPDQEAAPLSFAQERMWFFNQLEPDSPAYNRPLALRLIGPLDQAILEQSLAEILRRHEVLRAAFSNVEGRPLQLIRPVQPIGLRLVDLSPLPPAERESRARRLFLEEARRPFHLSQESLLRVHLLRLEPENQILLLVIHHIAFDGWSAKILIKELARLYEAFSAGQPVPLPPLPIQYADFAYWQRQRLQGELLETQLSYWQKKLKDVPPKLNLAADRPRPSVQTYQGAHYSLTLTSDLVRALKSLSQQEGCTLFMTLLAAFQVLLYRYTGQEDLVIGSPIAGRTQVETETLIGIFINTLVLRTNLAGNPSFKDLLARVRETTLEAYAHQDVPFEKLVEVLKPERDPGYTPLFQVIFNLENIPDQRIETASLGIEELNLEHEVALFDLNLELIEQEGGLTCLFKYNTALFDAATIERMASHFQTLLAQVVAEPDKPIGLYSLATPRARDVLPDPGQLLPEPDYELLPQTFLSWVKSNPNRPAINQDNQDCSYQTLAKAALSLAQLLLAQGLEKGEVVAVTGPRSFGLIAAMISIWFSGGVLLTLDQKLPRQRQHSMLQAAKTKCLLYIGAPQPHDERLGQSLQLITINPHTGQIANPADLPLNPIQLPELAPQDPAYLFFTSGTTGQPKGILGSQKGLAHFLAWQRQSFAVSSHDRSAQLTGLSFDVVLRDIFLPLTSGATLCLPPASSELEPTQVLRWLEQEHITLLHTVPSLLQAWLTDPPADITLPSLRWLFSAGEPLTETLVRRWRNRFPQAGNIANLYGPTETTLAKCCYIVPDAGLTPGIQPIGTPLPQTQALVLTKDRRLCGIGEPGEIVIRTPFRTLGYLNASEQDKKRFSPNPFRADPQDLLYYTGDRGRYRPDGQLEILGRLDHQLKIRGMRVEPGEIEAVLSQHPQVQQAVVIAWETEASEKQLVAYVVTGQERPPAESDLDRYLHQKLPDYMIPSSYVTLPALPLTPNGKVDRRALPAPTWQRPHWLEPLVPPRNPIEESLAGIWAEILKLEQVGIHDNFFHLGGHSLLATQLLSRIDKTFQLHLPLRRLFEQPTIAGLAQIIAQLKHDNPQSHPLALTTINRERYRLKR